MRTIDIQQNPSFLSASALVGMVLLLSGLQAFASEYYTWQEYSPTVAYDYQDEYGTLSPPTKVLDDVTNDNGDPVGTYASGWWCFRWGSDKNSLVTEDAWIPMLERFNDDFSYITDVMRWPRDKRAREGYYSTVYLFGSGLSTDNASNTEGGGWQGTTWYNGQAWPMVLASYIPVYAFDPASGGGDDYQTGSMIHEGIHCILSSMPGCKNAGWFHEGGNTWLQGTMEAQRSGRFDGMGWLSAGAAICPFMPIECYSGWLQDGSFGGPSAEGVNVYENGQQLCTWRNLLGGTQYGECFPHALEVILGPKSVAWIWRYSTQSGRVLQDLAEAPGGLGETQIRRLIQEYRARQAFCDFGQWSYAYRRLLNNNWGVKIEEEYTPYWYDVDPWYVTCYAATTQSGSVLTPEARTLPGWSGANQIPLAVSPAATEATVTFNPIGENMSCQLVYRDTSGDIHYGVPVSSGDCSIPLANVRNNVVIAVICNTDYIYHGESTRTAKYDYRLSLGAGVTGKAAITTRWYDYNPPRYTITALPDANGTTIPSGDISVNSGANQTFTFTPDAGHEVDQVLLNGFPIGDLDSYTFSNVRGDHTIGATFRYDFGLRYDFENNTDDAAGSDDASAAGSPAYTGGVYGRAIDLDGSDDYLTVPSGVADTEDMTVAVWVNWDGGAVSQRIFDFGDDTTRYMYLTPNSPSNTLRFAITTGGSGAEQIVETLPLAVDQWTHVAVTLHGDAATLYVDGMPTAVNEAVTVNPIDFTPKLNYLGKSQGSDPLFGGQLDDFRLYKYALSGADILDLAGVDVVPPADPTGLIAIAGDGMVSLDWNDNPEPDLVSYTVYRSTISGNGYEIIAGEVGASDFLDTAVVNGTQYFYVVTATDTSSNVSEYSSESTVVPNAASPVGIIGINVGNTNYRISPTTAAGVSSYGYHHANWNNVLGGTSGSASNLTDNSGSATTLSFSWLGRSDTFNTSGSGDAILTGNFVQNGTFVLTDIPYASYNLVLYYNAFGSAFNDSQVDLDYGSDTVTDRTVYISDKDPGYSVNGSDYVEFISSTSPDGAPAGANFGIVTGLTASHLTIIVIDGSDPHNSLAGFQIIGTCDSSPSFTTDPLNAADAIEDAPYSSTLADNIVAPEPSLTFSKESGPDWLFVTNDGLLSGTPSDSDVGGNVFTARVTNQQGLYDMAQVTIQVANVYSGVRGMEDLAGVASQWLAAGCADIPACGGADLDGDFSVTLSDLVMLAQNWVER